MAYASQPAPSPPHPAFSKMEAPYWVSASRNAGLPLSPAPRWTMVSFQRGGPPAFLIPHLCVAKALKQTRAAKKSEVHFLHQVPTHWAEVLPQQVGPKYWDPNCPHPAWSQGEVSTTEYQAVLSFQEKGSISSLPATGQVAEFWPRGRGRP